MNKFFGAIVGHGNKSEEDRNQNDFYPTPALATYTLAQLTNIPKRVWEPAAGRGHIAAELDNLGHIVYASDLHAYDKLKHNVEPNVNFLNATECKYDAIITNPPYKDKMAENFVIKAIELEPKFIAVLCRMQFIAGGSRYDNIYKTCPPNTIIALSQRINCSEEAADSDNAKDHIGGMLEYFWYVWDFEKAYTCTEIIWGDLRYYANQFNYERHNNLGDFFD